MRALLRTADLTGDDLDHLLTTARAFKHGASEQPGGGLKGKTVVCYFAKPSTRTRVSFETAIARLGGTPIAVGPNELQLGRGETIEDTHVSCRATRPPSSSARSTTTTSPVSRAQHR